MENDEDMLDFFAGMTLVGMASDENHGIGNPKYADHLSRLCYVQAQSMLRVRKEFLNDTRPDHE